MKSKTAPGKAGPKKRKRGTLAQGQSRELLTLRQGFDPLTSHSVARPKWVCSSKVEQPALTR